MAIEGKPAVSGRLALHASDAPGHLVTMLDADYEPGASRGVPPLLEPIVDRLHRHVNCLSRLPPF